jgi:hypothetical protein
MTTRASTPGDRTQLMRRKLAELDEQIARAQGAREAIAHGLRCPHEDITQCPNFNAGITARLGGQPLSRSHQQLPRLTVRLARHRAFPPWRSGWLGRGGVVAAQGGHMRHNFPACCGRVRIVVSR